MAKDKGDYKAKQAGESRVKKERSVAPDGEIEHTVWAEAYKGVDQKFVDKPKSDNEWTRCGMKNDAWKYCRKPVQVSAVYRGPTKPKRQASWAPKRRPQVATLAVDGEGESSRRAAQTPLGWAFVDVQILYEVIEVPRTTVIR